MDESRVGGVPGRVARGSEYVFSVGGTGKRSRDQRRSLPVGFAYPVAPRVTLVPPYHLYICQDLPRDERYPCHPSCALNTYGSEAAPCHTGYGTNL